MRNCLQNCLQNRANVNTPLMRKKRDIEEHVVNRGGQILNEKIERELVRDRINVLKKTEATRMEPLMVCHAMGDT